MPFGADAYDCAAEPEVLEPVVRTRRRQPAWYARKIDKLLRAADEAMAHAHGVFTGPSIDFHEWALAGRETARSDAAARQLFLRNVFGTLVAWGMHRMGPKGAHMPRHHSFSASILSTWPDIEALWNAGPVNCARDWATLCRVYTSLAASTTNSKLVANSKALAHLLPGSVAVIDRQYTMRFLELRNHYSRGVNSGDANFQWRLFRELHEWFFYPLIKDPRFVAALDRWPAPADGTPAAMREAPLKAADALIVGYLTSRRITPNGEE